MTNKKILHFDDEPLISKTVGESLHIIYGWDVRLVFEIDDLFRELQSNQYNAIIMDIMAPLPPLENEHITFTQEEIDEMYDGMNTGVILTEKIWRMGNYEDLPVLFLSARSRPDIITKYQSDGHRCAYIKKPELAAIIDKELRELLSKEQP